MSQTAFAIKSAVEYPLPASSQTHEVVLIAPDLLLVSQQPSGALVKLRLDQSSGRPLESVAHVIDSPFSGLHGLTVSKRHPGYVWVTLQFSSQLVLIDPVAQDLAAPPIIIKRIQLPKPALGPHVVAEEGDTLWTSCKDSHHIVQINSEDPSNARVIPCPPRPIFVQVHPSSGDIYATLDQTSQLFRIFNSMTNEPDVIPISVEYGTTPVGMVPGPDGNLWFVLLGNASGGSGCFGRILVDGQVNWFQLHNGPAANAAFIHLGFPPASTGENLIYLLASSMASSKALNAVVELRMSKDYSRVEAQQTVTFPSQLSMSHRVLYTNHGIYATELGTCSLVHLHTARFPWGEGVNEVADPYGLWGYGVPKSAVRYPVPDQNN